jgi:hypothetical protein
MAAKDKLADATAWLQDQWLEFRERSGFFQARVAIVVAYVVVVIATLTIFPVPAPSLDVKVTQVQFGLSERTKVVVKNLDLGKIRKADIVIYGQGTQIDGSQKADRWKTRKDVFLPENEPLALESRDLRSDSGRSAPASFTVDKLEVYDDGDLVATWPRGY